MILTPKRGNRDHKTAGYDKIYIRRDRPKKAQIFIMITWTLNQTPTLLEGLIATEMTGSGTWIDS